MCRLRGPDRRHCPGHPGPPDVSVSHVNCAGIVVGREVEIVGDAQPDDTGENHHEGHVRGLHACLFRGAEAVHLVSTATEGKNPNAKTVSRAREVKVAGPWLMKAALPKV